ncbi:MAG: TetR/AcrR family transcriptional regulator [Roseiflexaceae bacterium]|nr:TetR/AcrR family transcriptional regulator [Roseiflexaceae bacterium]
MPRTPLQFQAVREERRALILQAALRVFAHHGFASATVRQVAQEAGIAQGLLYSYFASKEAVLRAIMEESMRDVLESFTEAHAGTSSEAQLELLLRHSFVLIDQHRDFWRLSYSVRMQPEVLAQLGEAITGWITAITSTLEEHLSALDYADPAIGARMLFAQIDGVAQHYTLDPEGYPLARVLDAMVAQYARRRH